MSSPSAVLWALSDATRVDIMERVAAGGSATATQLSADLPITRQAVARHLKTLEAAELLTGTKQGRENLYHANLRPMGEASQWLNERSANWSRALGRLEIYLNEDS